MSLPALPCQIIFNLCKNSSVHPQCFLVDLKFLLIFEIILEPSGLNTSNCLLPAYSLFVLINVWNFCLPLNLFGESISILVVMLNNQKHTQKIDLPLVVTVLYKSNPKQSSITHLLLLLCSAVN